jgi:Zn-dependent M32 family carboxypeptidase
MSISKGKKRVPNLTGNITATTVIFTVQAKDTYLKIKIPDTFLGDRKKFKAYETQCRIYLWTDRKRGDWRNLKTISEQVLFITSRLREEAFARLKPYITQILEKEYANSEKKVKKIFNNINLYFNLLRQSFGDLDKTRTAEL